jgi:hypothetical protein
MADHYNGDLYDVFFSHATPDKLSTEPLYAALVARGLRVFRDYREIDELTPDIPAALRDALTRSVTGRPK